MKQCQKCGRRINSSVRFCPYCGEKISHPFRLILDNANKDSANSGLVAKKTLSKKALLKMAIVFLLVVVIGAIAFCEIRISNAKALYNQGKYTAAARLIKNIPVLGREEIIRIQTAEFAGMFYESYLTIKRIRLSSTSFKSEDAYQDAFFELVFGLHIDLKWMPEELLGDPLNEIKRSEYQKFIDLFRQELKTKFSMSDDEINILMDAFADAHEVEDMHTIANDWLEKNFFN